MARKIRGVSPKVLAGRVKNRGNGKRGSTLGRNTGRRVASASPSRSERRLPRYAIDIKDVRRRASSDAHGGTRREGASPIALHATKRWDRVCTLHHRLGLSADKAGETP